ncbi:nuclease-related domain-containing protein [Arthrobacter sp. MDT3-24]
MAGEQRTAGILAGLERNGYRVLRSIPLSPRKDVDHLVVGPKRAGDWKGRLPSTSCSTSRSAPSTSSWRSPSISSSSQESSAASPDARDPTSAPSLTRCQPVVRAACQRPTVPLRRGRPASTGASSGSASQS